MEEPTQNQEQQELEEVSDEIKETEKREGGRLAFFLFFATLLGSLLGAASDLSTVGVVVMPLVEWLAPSPQLRILGSETVLGKSTNVATAWEEGFTDLFSTVAYVPILGPIERLPHIHVEEIDSHVGFKLAPEGEASLLLVTEPMTDTIQEKIEDQGITIRCAAAIGFDIIAFITHLDNEDLQLSVQDISKILTGEITDWSDLGYPAQPINVLVDPKSGAADIVLQNLTGSNELRPHFIKCTSNDDCFDTALAMPGSFYWASASWLDDQPAHYLKIIAVKDSTHPPQDPFRDSFNPDWYPQELIRPLYIYAFSGGPVDPSSADLAIKYVEFARGVQGQEILDKNNFYTYFNTPIHVKPELPPGFGPRPDGPPVVCKSVT